MERSVYRELDECDTNDPANSRDSLPPVSLPVYSDEAPSHSMLTARALAEWRWANVDNLDLFLRQVYEYYVDKGFYCILLSRILKMITVLFVVVFGTYLYSCIDYSKLRSATSLQQIRADRCLARTSWLHYFGLYIFALLWILKLFQYASDTRTLWEIHDFYHHMLHISENEIQTISWQQVVERLVELRAINGASHKRLDAHGIVNRIMRQENYMIALYNKNVLDLNVQLPLRGNYEFLTKVLEWSISMCLEDYVFNERGQLRSIVLREDKRDLLAEGLRRRLQFAAIMNIILAPVAIFYMSLYYFFRYFNDFYTNPKQLGIRQYTPLAEWRFRELNELFHLFKRRVSMSDQPAKHYISQFPREKTELLLRFIIFIFSSFAAVLVALSIYDPELLNLEIKPGQNVLFYITSLGLAIAVSRAMLSTPQEQAIYQPEAAMRQIIEFTHYMPDSWENKLHTEPVKAEFMTLYDLKPMIIVRDLFSVIINPVILGIKLANRSERIIDFFREFSVKIDDLGGYVCSLAIFDIEHVNKVKARSDALDKYYATQDGKMLKSYLNFMDVYGPAQSRNYVPMYQSMYSTQSRSQLQAQLPHQAPQQPPMPHQSVMASSRARPGLEASVMGQYDKIRSELASVEEEGPRTNSTSETRLFSDDEGEEDESIAEDGVLGLLNNLYKK